MSRPDDDSDSEIKDSELTIPELEVPKFKDEIPASELPNISKRDAPLVIFAYKMAKQIDFLVDAAIQNNRHHRQMERRHLKLKRLVERQVDWRKSLVRKWGLLVAGATIVTTALTTSLIGAICRVILEKLFNIHP